MSRSALLTYQNDFEQDEAELQKIRECRRLLLDAGADPTLFNGEGINLLLEVVCYGTLASSD